MEDERKSNCSYVQLGRGEIGGWCAAFAGEQMEIFERMVERAESRLCLREEEWAGASQPPNQRLLRGFACKSRRRLNNFPVSVLA